MNEETVYKAEKSEKLRAKNPGPAYIIIGIGILLLAANVFDFELMEYLWPGFVIAPGLMLLWPAYHSTPENKATLSFLAVPGAVLTMTGLMLFVMNLTNHFEAWAYSWTLLLVAVAWAFMYINRFEPERRIHERGHRFIRTMMMIFGGLFVLFELVIWSNFHPLLALALIGYGVYVLVSNRRNVKTS
jgi:hypothetical protein